MPITVKLIPVDAKYSREEQILYNHLNLVDKSQWNTTRKLYAYLFELMNSPIPHPIFPPYNTLLAELKEKYDRELAYLSSEQKKSKDKRAGTKKAIEINILKTNANLKYIKSPPKMAIIFGLPPSFLRITLEDLRNETINPRHGSKPHIHWVDLSKIMVEQFEAFNKKVLSLIRFECVGIDDLGFIPFGIHNIRYQHKGGEQVLSIAEIEGQQFTLPTTINLEVLLLTTSNKESIFQLNEGPPIKSIEYALNNDKLFLLKKQKTGWANFFKKSWKTFPVPPNSSINGNFIYIPVYFFNPLLEHIPNGYQLITAGGKGGKARYLDPPPNDYKWNLYHGAILVSKAAIRTEWAKGEDQIGPAYFPRLKGSLSLDNYLNNGTIPPNYISCNSPIINLNGTAIQVRYYRLTTKEGDATYILQKRKGVDVKVNVPQSIRSPKSIYNTIKNKRVFLKKAKPKNPRKDAGSVMTFLRSQYLLNSPTPPYSDRLSAGIFFRNIVPEGHLSKKYIDGYSHKGYEWCHLLGHGDGGGETYNNFVCGSFHCNTEQLAIESALRTVSHYHPNMFQLRSTAYLQDQSSSGLKKTDKATKDQIRQSVFNGELLPGIDIHETLKTLERLIPPPRSQAGTKGKIPRTLPPATKKRERDRDDAFDIPTEHNGKLILFSLIKQIEKKTMDYDFIKTPEKKKARSEDGILIKEVQELTGKVRGLTENLSALLKEKLTEGEQANHLAKLVTETGLTTALAKLGLISGEHLKKILSTFYPDQEHLRNEIYYNTNRDSSAPIAAFIHYKIYIDDNKLRAAAASVPPLAWRNIFDYTFEGQSEFFDKNQFNIVYHNVKAVMEASIVATVAVAPAADPVPMDTK